MLKNYLLIAWRQIVKNKIYAAINILGLVTGLIVFIFGSLLVQYENSHDTFFEKADRIFTAGSVFGPDAGVGVAMNDSIYTAVGPLIEADVDSIEAVARTVNREFLVSVGDDNYYEVVRFTDPAFLEIFDLSYIAGDSRALQDPNGLMLSRSMAEKLFGRVDVAGEMITLDHDVSLRVNAVIENLPVNSHFTSALIGGNSQGLNITAPLAALNQANGWDLAGNWNNLSTGDLTYMLFPEGSTIEDAQQTLDRVWETHYEDDMKEFIIGMRARNVVDANTVIWDMIGLPILESVQILAILVLVVAIVNYTNLATAQSLGRAREVGLRKTMGATRGQLLLQFLVESICIVAISMLISLAALELIVPFFNEASGRGLVINYASTLPWLFATTLIVGIVSGAYPAYLITRTTPITALKESATRGNRGGVFRSTMLGLQFTISIFMLAMVIVVYAQNQKVVNSSEIFPRDQIVTLQRLAIDDIQARRETLANEVRQIDGVEQVSYSSQVPYEQSNSYSNYSNVAGDDTNDYNMNRIFIDDAFLETYDIPLLAGRNFDRAIAADTIKEGVLQANVVVNELAVSKMGLPSADAAIGHVFYDFADDREPRAYTVVGVVPDQNFLGFHNELKAINFMVSEDEDRYRIGSVRVSAGVPLGSVISQIEQRWEQLIPAYPIQTQLLNETFADTFDIFNLTTRVLGTFAIIALLLSTIGLFGLAAFMAQSRTKEIGIRKVMGANIPQIVRLLVWQFSKPVMWSLLLALPLAYFASNMYLNFFAERISAPAGIVVGSGVAAILFSWVIVGIHAWRVARENPIRALRYE